jgi:hypothetical protein
VADDGRRMVTSSLVEGKLSVFTSSDGIAWKRLAFSGDTAILPGDGAVSQAPIAGLGAYELYVVQDGIVATGISISGNLWRGQTLWLARAVP